MEWILASGSPRRRELLGRIIPDFSVQVSQVEEQRDPAWTVQELPKRLALQKALDVSSRNRSALVIGADTIVSLDGMVLGKPRDEEDAMDMLRALSGRTHLVYTGVAFCCGGQALSSFVQCTEVDFYPLTEEQIQRCLTFPFMWTARWPGRPLRFSAATCAATPMTKPPRWSGRESIFWHSTGCA